MVTVVVARHGATEWTELDRVQGWAPVPLSERGRTQAASLGQRLDATYDVDRVVASDIRRCYETADIITDRLDAEHTVETDPAWRERDFGLSQGLADDVAHPLWEGDERPYLVADDRGETWADVRVRVLDAWDSLAAAVGEQTVVVVTHAGPIANLLTHLRGQPSAAAADVSVDETGVTVVDISGDSSRICRHNCTEHLGD